ncbi:MAG: NusA-like transcription termination signal-binding factor [Candidatus Thorarchaeota archaeon]
MPRVRLSMDDMALIATFERITGVSAVDVIQDDTGNRLIFVVRPRQLGKAIGRGGSTILSVSDAFEKHVDVVELADTAEDFIKSALAPARVEHIKIQEDRHGHLIAHVTVKAEDRGIAIGRDGRNVARARLLAKRHFGLDNVLIV